MPGWPAIILQALLFTLFAWAIGAAPTWLDASFIFFFGFVLGILRGAKAVPAAIGFHLAFMSTQQFLGPAWGLFEEMGRASCRESGWQYVSTPVVPISLKQQRSTKH